MTSAQQQAISSGLKRHWRKRKAQEARQRTGTFHYVTFDRVEEFHRLGWMVVAPLGFWSVLMWRCDCGEET